MSWLRLVLFSQCGIPSCLACSNVRECSGSAKWSVKRDIAIAFCGGLSRCCEHVLRPMAGWQRRWLQFELFTGLTQDLPLNFSGGGYRV